MEKRSLLSPLAKQHAFRSLLCHPSPLTGLVGRGKDNFGLKGFGQGFGGSEVGEGFGGSEVGEGSGGSEPSAAPLLGPTFSGFKQDFAGEAHDAADGRRVA